jgi:uncharacterized protein (TIRG00374 family)
LRWLKLVIGIVLLFVPLFFVEWRETASILVSADVALLLAAWALLSINMPLSSVKWELLLRLQGIHVGFMPALRAYWIGSFFSNYLPSNVGGDVVRLIVLKAEGKRAEVASSIIVERIAGLLVLLAFAAWGLASRPQYFDFTGVIPLLWALIAAASAMLAGALIWNQQAAALLNMLPFGSTGVIAKATDFLSRIASAVTIYRRQPSALLIALLLSVPFYLFLMMVQYLALTAVGAQVALIEVMFVTPVILLIAMIPISINGLGIAEGAFLLFYTQLGVTPEAALAGALAVRILSLMVSLLGWFFWIGSPRVEPAG